MRPAAEGEDTAPQDVQHFPVAVGDRRSPDGQARSAWPNKGRGRLACPNPPCVLITRLRGISLVYKRQRFMLYLPTWRAWFASAVPPVRDEMVGAGRPGPVCGGMARDETFNRAAQPGASPRPARVEAGLAGRNRGRGPKGTPGSVRGTARKSASACRDQRSARESSRNPRLTYLYRCQVSYPE